jgi:hypothetical protein
MSARISRQTLRQTGIGRPSELSETGTRGILTMPHSIASISAKSETTQGNNSPSG